MTDAIDLDRSGAIDSEESSSGSDGASDDAPLSPRDPLDPSAWIGPYHFEHPDLPFGERGDPNGTYSLVNFELFPDSRAVVEFDDCFFDHPLTYIYEWTPSEAGWLDLQPGPGEKHLRLFGIQKVDTIRVQLIEPGHELRFEANGVLNTFFTFRPDASCWVDRCTTRGIMQVDYCD